MASATTDESAFFDFSGHLHPTTGTTSTTTPSFDLSDPALSLDFDSSERSDASPSDSPPPPAPAQPWDINWPGTDLGLNDPSNDLGCFSSSNGLPADFNFSFPMDLDFDPTRTSSIDPSALLLSNAIYPPGSDPSLSFPTPDLSIFLPAHERSTFPPTAPSPPFSSSGSASASEDEASRTSGGRHRRASITFTSSSSGPSLSPIIHPHAADSIASSSGPSSFTTSVKTEAVNPFDELAQRARQNAGVMLAVPTSASTPFTAAPFQSQALASASANLLSPEKTTSTFSSSPAPSTPASAPSPPTNSSTSGLARPPSLVGTVTIGPSGRPKTDHTTIERRYRTNLNALFQSLTAAVPALRVLENKERDKESSTSGTEAASDPGAFKGMISGEDATGDVVDARGFADGVKVARKVSKANVLGKAVEYIRVLKKREARLMREQEGLKSLLCGLVGGPALLKEWEHEWRAKFGGPERDEVDPASLGGSDDGDGSDAEDDDEDESASQGARKKAKVASGSGKAKSTPKAGSAKAKVKRETPPSAGPQPVVQADGSVVALPEKRKRGRPRKVPVPPVSATAPAPAPATMPAMVEQTQIDPALLAAVGIPVPMDTTLEQQQQQQAPTQQYLLAGFAFFSIFNSPFTPSFSTSSTPRHDEHHHHTGTVLTHPPNPPSGAVQWNWSWSEIVQAFHLFVATLVLLSIALPWLPRAIRRSRMALFALSPFSIVTPATASRSADDNARVSPGKQRRALNDALAPARKGAKDEAEVLRTALGVRPGFIGMLESAFTRKLARADSGIYELRQLEQRAWVRLAEIVAVDRTACLGVRIQTYTAARSRIAPFAASTSDLSTLALLLYPAPILRKRAIALWSKASQVAEAGLAGVRAHEQLVLKSLSVHEAAERMHTLSESAYGSPLSVLATSLVKERVTAHAAELFADAVLPPDDEFDADGDSTSGTAEKFKDRRALVEAAHSLGGLAAELSEVFGRACRGASSDADASLKDDLPGSGWEDAASLLRARALFRRALPSKIGPGVVLSPPPTSDVARKQLRTLLGKGVFEQRGERVEEAKDAVVDGLEQEERAERPRRRPWTASREW